jgi:hypothetical protein
MAFALLEMMDRCVQDLIELLFVLLRACYRILAWAAPWGQLTFGLAIIGTCDKRNHATEHPINENA